MEKLDVKDRKILYELDLDSRQSFRNIGRNVGLSKDIVAYRVKKLQEKGIIKNFYTEVNGFKLGYTEVKFYFTYQNVTPEIKQEIIDYLAKSSYTDVVHSLEGQYDLCITSYVGNVAEFYNIWSNIINKYRDFFSNQVFCVESLNIIFKKTFLVDEKTDKKEDRIIYLLSANDKKAEMDSLDYKILELLAPNSRIQTLELAEKLKSSVKTIKSRIRRLVKTGVITRYTINIDWPKIGYQWFKADIILNNPKKIQQITEYIQNNPHLLFRVESLGYVDLELTFILSNLNQLYQIMEDLSSRFPDVIKNFKYFSITKTHKYYGVDFWNR
jgi:DNA-binding Lrp family transcriptional regulator